MVQKQKMKLVETRAVGSRCVDLPIAPPRDDRDEARKDGG